MGSSYAAEWAERIYAAVALAERSVVKGALHGRTLRRRTPFGKWLRVPRLGPPAGPGAGAGGAFALPCAGAWGDVEWTTGG
jgi:hypothetical protein